MDQSVALEPSDDSLPPAIVECRADARRVVLETHRARVAVGRRWPGVPVRSRRTAPRYARSDPSRAAWRGTATEAAARATGSRARSGTRRSGARGRGRSERRTPSWRGSRRRHVRRSRGGKRIGRCLQRGRSIVHAEAANEPATDVRIDHADGLRERERGDRARRVGPDAREPLQRADVGRPAVALHDGRRRLQREGAPVVAQPAPLGQHGRGRRLRQLARRSGSAQGSAGSARRPWPPASAGA